MADDVTAELVRGAAVVLLHREIMLHGEVVLSPTDFAIAANAEGSGQAIQLSVRGGGTDVVLTHSKPDASRSID